LLHINFKAASMKIHRVSLLLILPIYLISCTTQQRMPYYLENVTDTIGKGEIFSPELRIQKNDLLSIQVYSPALDEKADAYYNPLSSSGAATTSGYLVDVNGNIEYPRLGVFHAEGLTKQELAAQIKKRLTEPVELLKDPTIVIRFMNFRVSVLGEVGAQGVITVPVERLTILEAMGMAGGINNFGKRDKVKVIRETNGKREIGIIDLTSKDVFESPYYHLQQNDVVLVEPTGRKSRIDEQNIVAQRVSFALSVITAAAFLYNIFK